MGKLCDPCRFAGGGSGGGVDRQMAHLNRSLKQKLLAGIALAAVIAGGTVAVVTAGTDHHASNSAGNSASAGAKGTGRTAPPGGRGDLSAAARYLGVTPAKLRGQMRSGRTLAQVAASTSGKSEAGLIGAIITAREARLSAAVSAGALSRADESAILATLPRRVALRVNSPTRQGPGLVPVPGLASIASYLGVSGEQVRKDLRSGQTLAQVADATAGKSAAGLIAALVTARKAKLEAAVTAGKLTRAKSDKLLAHLPQRITAEVNGTLSKGTRPGTP
jgi:hypothetical protein